MFYFRLEMPTTDNLTLEGPLFTYQRDFFHVLHQYRQSILFLAKVGILSTLLILWDYKMQVSQHLKREWRVHIYIYIYRSFTALSPAISKNDFPGDTGTQCQCHQESSSSETSQSASGLFYIFSLFFPFFGISLFRGFFHKRIQYFFFSEQYSLMFQRLLDSTFTPSVGMDLTYGLDTDNSCF